MELSSSISSIESFHLDDLRQSSNNSPPPPPPPPDHDKLQEKLEKVEKLKKKEKSKNEKLSKTPASSNNFQGDSSSIKSKSLAEKRGRLSQSLLNLNDKLINNKNKTSSKKDDQNQIEEDKKSKKKFLQFLSRFRRKKKDSDEISSEFNQDETFTTTEKKVKLRKNKKSMITTPQSARSPASSTGWCNQENENQDFKKSKKSSPSSENNNNNNNKGTAVTYFDEEIDTSPPLKTRSGGGGGGGIGIKSFADYTSRYHSNPRPESSFLFPRTATTTDHQNNAKSNKKWFKKEDSDKDIGKRAMKKIDKGSISSEEEAPNYLAEEEVENKLSSPMISPGTTKRIFTLDVSDESDNDEKITSGKKSQRNFLNEDQEINKKSRGTFSTKVTELVPFNDDDNESESPPIFVKKHKEKSLSSSMSRIEYDANLMEDNAEEMYNNLPLSWLVNILADKYRRPNVGLIDTRSYDKFSKKHIVYAQHISDYQDERMSFTEDSFARYELIILYNETGNIYGGGAGGGGGEEDENGVEMLKECRKFITKNLTNLPTYLLEVGFNNIANSHSYLCVKRERAQRTLPSCFDNFTFYLSDTGERHLKQLIDFCEFSHVISMNMDVMHLMPPNVYHLNINNNLTKDYHFIDDSQVIIHFETIWQFINKKINNNNHHVKQSSSSSSTTRENKYYRICFVSFDDCSIICILFLIACLMRRNHWSLADSYRHVMLRRSNIQFTKQQQAYLKILEKKIFDRLYTKYLPKIGKIPFLFE